MNTPRSRRSLLASAVPFAMALTGCLEEELKRTDADDSSNDVIAADAYDCADVDRPEPETPSHENALEPASYPSAPEPILEGVDQYVIDFEEAYRRNAFVAEFGAEARVLDFQFDARQVDEIDAESDRDAALISVVYNVKTRTRRQTEPSSTWDTRVTYYVDEHVVLRARYTGGIADGPSFDPDPRLEGEPVACIE